MRVNLCSCHWVQLCNDLQRRLLVRFRLVIPAVLVVFEIGGMQLTFDVVGLDMLIELLRCNLVAFIAFVTVGIGGTHWNFDAVGDGALGAFIITSCFLARSIVL